MNKPFLLTPAPKEFLWGGSRLNDDFNKDMDVFPFGESWECSTHPEGVSLVDGVPLTDIFAEHPGYLGTHPLSITEGAPTLPILVKLIDAKEKLSIQVHPDDVYAKRVENSLGKTEMWYVVDARKDSEVIYGFKQNMNEDRIRSSVESGRLELYLNHVPVKKNDVFFVEPGTVHAIGAGCLIAEIQENSNITYRLYDYDRTDKMGEKRELHLEKAIDVVNMESSLAPRQPLRVLKYKNGCASELLSRCKYFQIERMLINTESHRELVEFQTGSNSFHVLLCVDGCGSVSGDGFVFNFFKGDCVFVPAESEMMRIHGKAQMLDVSC